MRDGMVDREKVIKALETCVNYHKTDFCEIGCGHNGCLMIENDCCVIDVMPEIIALLKAQEAKLVYITAEINHRKIGECPNCRSFINSGDYPNYCGHCGQAVKWE